MSRRPAADRLAAVFGLDARSLAAFRIALGGLIFVDLAIRASDFGAMYSDAGFAPVETLRQGALAGQWSLYFLSGATVWQAGLMVVAAVFALAFAAGYRTRLATIGSWVLIYSLHVRLPVILNAGDTLLRLLLFWSMFLPLGRAWSLDARASEPGRERRPELVFSAATFAFIVQLALVYWFAALAKWNDDWLHRNALADVFGFGLYGLPLGRRLLDYPQLTQLLTRTTIVLELLLPALLFVPWRPARWRMVAVATAILFHIGIALTITVGLFSYVSIAAWLALLPAEFWQKILPAQQSSVSRDAEAERAADRSRFRPFLTTAAPIAALAIVLYWNIAVLGNHRLPKPVDRWIVRAANAAGLRQAWGLFGQPPRQDCWYVYEALLKDGRRVELLSGEQATAYKRPASASAQFPNHRWRKLHWRLPLPAGKPYRQPVAEFVCRQWNAVHSPDEQVARLDVYCYRQPFGDSSGHFTRERLAQVVLAPEGGNFAEAVRELDL